jgi:hypothetical protein
MSGILGLLIPLVLGGPVIFALLLLACGAWIAQRRWSRITLAGFAALLLLVQALQLAAMFYFGLPALENSTAIAVGSALALAVGVAAWVQFVRKRVRGVHTSAPTELTRLALLLLLLALVAYSLGALWRSHSYPSLAPLFTAANLLVVGGGLAAFVGLLLRIRRGWWLAAGWALAVLIHVGRLIMVSPLGPGSMLFSATSLVALFTLLMLLVLVTPSQLPAGFLQRTKRNATRRTSQ